MCLNCGRDWNLTDHHLIPRALGGRRGQTMSLCEDCHGHLHSQFNNTYLKSFLSTAAAVVANGAMVKFGVFAAKQRGGRITKRNNKKRGHRV